MPIQLFQRKPPECVSIEDDGQTVDFYMRRPSGRDLLSALAATKVEGRTEADAARELLGLVVNKDGSPIADDEREQLLDMPQQALLKLIAAIQERITRERTPADAAKKG